MRPARRDETGVNRGGLLLCLVLAVLPVLMVATPPIFDYPNHLARAHVIASLGGSDVFAAHFRTTSFLIPNVLADLVVLALLPLVGVMAAGQLLLAGTIVLTITGAVALNRAVAGRASAWPLLAALLVYNEGFFWGFLNYNLGLGLMLWALALVVAASERPAATRIVLGTGVALVIFLAHLVAFGLLAVAVAAIELRRLAIRRPGWGAGVRRLAEAGAPFLVPVALFLGLSPSGALAFGAAFDFSVWGKFMPFARLLSSGNPLLDFATLAALAATIGTGLAGGLARCHPVPLMLAGLCLLLVLVLPYSMLGSYFLDWRIIVAFALLLVASLTHAPGAPAGALAALVVAMVAWRSVALLVDWRAQAADTAAVIAALDQVPVGSVVVTSVGYPFELGDWVMTRRIQPAHEHTTLYATIRRDAVVPNIFAREGQNPLVFDSRLPELNRTARNPVGRVFHEGDARWMVDEVVALAEAKDRVLPPIPAVYVIGYRVPCAWWPVDRPVRLAACTPGFSLIEILPGRGPIP